MKYVILIALGMAAAADFARAETDAVQNGGFEDGVLYPWTVDTFHLGYAPGAGHTGDYVVSMGIFQSQTQYILEGWIRQTLDRTYYPDEVRSANFWIYPDFDSLRDGDRGPCFTEFSFRLGENEYGTTPGPGTGWGWLEQWYEIMMPLGSITTPFNYVYIWVKVHAYGAPPPYNLEAALDDISVTVTGTGVSPTSLGRVKALLR